MTCPYCGNAIRQGQTYCQRCGAAVGCAASGTQGGEYAYSPQDQLPITLPKRARRSGADRNKPSLALRVPLQILSLLLSFVLLVCLMGTALLMDCNRMLSAAGIKQVMNAVFAVSQSRPMTRPIAGALGAGPRLDEHTTLPPNVSISEDALSNIELPADVLTGGDAEALIDWIYEVAQQVAGEEIPIDRQQLQTFVEDSTLTDFLSEKAAGYAADFINGTSETQLTGEELMELLEENQELIESTFQVSISDEMKQELKTAIDTTIEENKINEVIHEQVFDAMEQAIDQALPIEWAKLQALLQTLTSGKLLLMAMGACVFLMLLLLALNFYNLPAGLTWSSAACIVAGFLLSLPIALLQASPDLLVLVLGLPGGFAQLIASFLGVFSLIHYGLLILGLVLLGLSILWRVIRAARREYD